MPSAITVHFAFDNAPIAPALSSAPDFNNLNALKASPILLVNVPRKPAAEPSVVPNKSALVTATPISVLAKLSKEVPASRIEPMKSLVIVLEAKFSYAALSN